MWPVERRHLASSYISVLSVARISRLLPWPGWDWFPNLVFYFLDLKLRVLFENQTIPTEFFCLCRLPYHDGRLVLRVCLWGCGGQEVPVLRRSGRYATGTHCAACLGPNGIVGVILEPSRPPWATSASFSAAFTGALQYFLAGLPLFFQIKPVKISWNQMNALACPCLFSASVVVPPERLCVYFLKWTSAQTPVKSKSSLELWLILT